MGGLGLSALDILVLIAVVGAAGMGVVRGFVSEMLSLFAWVAIVFAIKLFHTPVAAALSGVVGTVAGAAVLAFVVIAGVTYLAGRLISGSIGARTRTSVLGPLDRALGFAFGAIKGVILASLAFLLVVLVTDTMNGGPAERPVWLTHSRSYPVLNATSAGIADFVDRRRHGEPVFGPDTGVADEPDSKPTPARRKVKPADPDDIAIEPR